MSVEGVGLHKTFLHQDGKHVGCCLAVVLGADGVVLLQQVGVVVEQLFHEVVVYPCGGDLALLVGVVVH